MTCNYRACDDIDTSSRKVPLPTFRQCIDKLQTNYLPFQVMSSFPNNKNTMIDIMAEKVEAVKTLNQKRLYKDNQSLIPENDIPRSVQVKIHKASNDNESKYSSSISSASQLIEKDQKIITFTSILFANQFLAMTDSNLQNCQTMCQEYQPRLTKTQNKLECLVTIFIL